MHVPVLFTGNGVFGMNAESLRARVLADSSAKGVNESVDAGPVNRNHVSGAACYNDSPRPFEETVKFHCVIGR